MLFTIIFFCAILTLVLCKELKKRENHETEEKIRREKTLEADES